MRAAERAGSGEGQPATPLKPDQAISPPQEQTAKGLVWAAAWLLEQSWHTTDPRQHLQSEHTAHGGLVSALLALPNLKTTKGNNLGLEPGLHSSGGEEGAPENTVCGLRGDAPVTPPVWPPLGATTVLCSLSGEKAPQTWGCVGDGALAMATEQGEGACWPLPPTLPRATRMTKEEDA